MARQLSGKQLNFVNEYLVDFNAKQAATRAGYSKRTARHMGWENLNKPHIVEAIQQRRLELQEQYDIATPEEVLQSYTQDLRFDPADLEDEYGNALPLRQVPRRVRLSLTGMKIKESIIESEGGTQTVMNRWIEYKYPDKQKVRDSLARHFGLFEKDNQQQLGFLERIFERIEQGRRELPYKNSGRGHIAGEVDGPLLEVE